MAGVMGASRFFTSLRFINVTRVDWAPWAAIFLGVTILGGDLLSLHTFKFFNSKGSLLAVNIWARLVFVTPFFELAKAFFAAADFDVLSVFVDEVVSVVVVFEAHGVGDLYA